MKLCPSCGAQYEDAAKFCQHDGTLLRPAGGPAEEEDPYVGQVLLGQLEIQELIGSGGMGRVYRARQLGFDRPVAVKILHTELVENQEMVKRFNREARIISRLDHRAIIHVYLFGELPDGNLFLAMEFVDGRPLTKLIQEGPVPPTRAVHIAGQMLSALEEAHGKGVVHRDLKPDNIMLVHRGGDPDSVKVLDFGIAKFLGSRTMLTQQGLVFGSARYISPEAAAGEDVDERADLYAVGVILYHMLAGVPPFDDASAVSLLMRHVNDEAPDVLGHEGARAVPPSLGSAVMRALEKDPASRYQDAAAMRAALLDAAQRGGVALIPETAGGAGRWSSPPVAAVQGSSRPPAFDTNPMFGGKGGAAEAPAAGVASSAPPASPVPPPVSAEPSASVVPPRGSSSFEAPAVFDDDDDEPRIPRSRSWIILVVIGVVALFGGAAVVLFGMGGSGEARPAGSDEEAPLETPPGPGPEPEPGVAALVPAPSGAADAGPRGQDSGLVGVEPPVSAPDAAAAEEPGPSTTPPRESQRDRSSPRDRPSGMPPSATIQVSHRRPRVGSRVRLVAKVRPASPLRSPRFVIKGRDGGAPATLRAEPAGVPGLYAASHVFDEPGSYQVTFVARSAHGELRAFADARVADRPARPGPPDFRPPPPFSEDDGAGDVSTNEDENKPPDEVEEPWVPPVPLPTPPPAPW